MFSYAFARAYCEKHNLKLHTDPWIGQKIFNIDDPPIPEGEFPKRDENNLVDGESDFIFRSYCQQQKFLIYTKLQCWTWFEIRGEIADRLSVLNHLVKLPVGHRRAGDYSGYGYPVVSELSYRHAAVNFSEPQPTIFTEESSPYSGLMVGELRDIPDFYMLSKAAILFRGNSTFSWWAAVLGHSKVYSPIMYGCKGGEENHCSFIEGNWPRFRADLDFITDLHLPE